MGFKIKVIFFWNKLRLYLSFLLLAFYLVIACLFLFTDVWIDFLRNGRAYVGIVLLLFGAFRFYIAYRRYLNKKRKLKPIVEIKVDAKEE